MDKKTSTTSIQKQSQNTLELSGTEQLERLAKQVKVVSSMISGKAPSPFCETYAEDLLESFPDLELSEIFEAIKRGTKGEFGPVYLLNGTVLYDWVKKHSRYKYDHENKHPNETYLDRFRRNKIDPRETKEVDRFVYEEGMMPSTTQVIQMHFRTKPELFPYVQD